MPNLILKYNILIMNDLLRCGLIEKFLETTVFDRFLFLLIIIILQRWIIVNQKNVSVILINMSFEPNIGETSHKINILMFNKNVLNFIYLCFS